MTSLMWAAAKGHASVVCSLLETEDRGGINYQTEVGPCMPWPSKMGHYSSTPFCRIMDGVHCFSHMKGVMMVW